MPATLLRLDEGIANNRGQGSTFHRVWKKVYFACEVVGTLVAGRVILRRVLRIGQLVPWHPSQG